ncbi:hypothetical protein [Mesorhizobium sp. L-8-3]|uniref:hypothetical protein n=1 Tax=Mesorhizobium sp. L-8-3 TaxID=2744522 RepID=UPI0019281614|nr:hypothetical protein [Mesorhizobium sp. L-8-3]BCH26612.1 hypothetical protein MesoLjLb_63970 [Mesorhizobium sp. L-8-3]
MPLQNRVDPLGQIHAVPWRGTFTGNRGVIHDPATRTLLKRRWSTHAWLICVCDFRGRRREVMGRNAPSGNAGWTELFFLDEVTALAAGHRPCFYCRRERAAAFVACCAQVFGRSAPRATELDTRLHAERLISGGPFVAVEDEAAFTALPDGAVLRSGEHCFAKHGGALRLWTFRGYGERLTFRQIGRLQLLTPPTTLVALKAGYGPAWHNSIRLR